MFKGSTATKWLAISVIFLIIALTMYRTLMRPSGLDTNTHAYGIQLPTSYSIDAQWEFVDVFPDVKFDEPLLIVESPDTESEYLYVVEKRGVVLAVDRNTGQKKNFLDIRDSVEVRPTSELGLLGMAFHPEFASPASNHRGKVFIWYTAQESGVYFNRLSRFTASDSGSVSANTEVVLINQRSDHSQHNGGSPIFGPDGFLYLPLGDEGTGTDALENGQKIDKDLYSGIIRIDVNCDNIEISHIPPRQPETGGTQEYCIPKDNPFVGQEGVLEEFWSIGLRNPHRIAFDDKTGELWVGDVGSSHFEEINIASSGSNHGWSYQEGAAPFKLSYLKGKRPDPLIGEPTLPIFGFTHEEGRSAIIGGLVYRGKKFPELYGKYIYGDFGSGVIWALDRDEQGKISNTTIASLSERSWAGISSFGHDRDGNIYLAVLGSGSKSGPNGRIMKLQPRSDTSLASFVPGLLSETGLFEDTRTLTPSDALVPYSVNRSHWAGDATPRYWLALPPDNYPQSKLVYSLSGNWQFPPGTVFVQHYETNSCSQDCDNRSSTKIETRILVVQTDGSVYGLGYKWNSDGTDARLVEETHTESLPNGKQWRFLSSANCLACHNTESGYVLSFNTRQLNKKVLYPSGIEDNQLRSMSAAGLMRPRKYHVPPDYPGKIKRELLHYSLTALHSVPISAFPSVLLPKVTPPSSNSSLEDRAKSYLSVNCGHCHRPQGRGRTEFDLRFENDNFAADLGSSKVLNTMGLDPDSIRTIWPGHPDKSAIYLRMSSDDPALRMPLLGSADPDVEGIALIRAWIRSLED